MFKYLFQFSALGLLTLGMTACSSDDLPESFKLEKFRVLAIIADQPEVNPGDTVLLTPLLTDINGAGRAITFSASACVDPGVGIGATPSCVGSTTAVTLATDQAVTGLPAGTYTGPVTSTLSVTVPDSSVMFNSIPAFEQFNGVNYLVVFDFKLSSSETISAFKRILVSTRTTKHQNPQYESSQLFSGDTALSGVPTSETEIYVKVAPASAETYDVQNEASVAASQTESIQTFWYISDGDLSTIITDNSGVTRFTPPTILPTGRNMVIVTVTRDSRGGLSALVF